MFHIHILGSGSAIPTVTKRATAQIVHFSNKYYLIDCGEGTQVQLKKAKISFLKINHIFISHLHGDHYFGLVGLISSMHLLGRITDLHVYCPKGLKEIIDIQLKASTTILKYKIIYHFLESKKSKKVYEGKDMEVYTIPLKHKILTNGFLFKEKPKLRKIKAEKIDFYNIPHYQLPKIKEGEDFITPEGKVIENSKITFPPKQSRSYAFCSDTAYKESNIPLLKNVDMLYHEATFLAEDKGIAKKTFHSTVEQAAKIAKGAEIGELLIGHFSARYNQKNHPTFLAQGKAIFKNIKIASEGDVFDILLR